MANQYPAESKKNRDQAISEGKKRYLSATPCKKCGTYERYVSTYGCCKCVVEAGLKKLADKELMAPYRTKENQLKKQKAWREKNYEKYQQQWLRVPKEKVNARAANRRAKVRNQTPDLTEAEKDVILELYAEAKRLTEETGIPYEVDHIIPICKGGLHHPDNLQVITQKENRKKGGK
jgi:5-methylcytosine-specific restriction endonuclease McrA